MRTIYVGMDFHKNFIQAAAMDEQGNIIKEQKFKTDEEEIQRFVKSLKAQKIRTAIEATCTWYHVYETLNALGVETTLVNMRRTKSIAESKIKTDKLVCLLNDLSDSILRRRAGILVCPLRWFQFCHQFRQADYGGNLRTRRFIGFGYHPPVCKH